MTQDKLRKLFLRSLLQPPEDPFISQMERTARTLAGGTITHVDVRLPNGQSISYPRGQRGTPVEHMRSVWRGCVELSEGGQTELPPEAILRSMLAAEGWAINPRGIKTPPHFRSRREWELERLPWSDERLREALKELAHVQDWRRCDHPQREAGDSDPPTGLEGHPE